MLQNLTGLAVSGDALLVLNDSMYARQSKAIPNEGGVLNVIIETDVLVTPLREGTSRVRAQAQASIHPNQGFPGILAAYRPLIESDPLLLNAVNVPTAGALPGYTGAIGQWEIEQVALSTNAVRIGEPISLTIAFRGEGNLQTVEPPAIPRTSGWQLMPPAPSLAEFVPNSITVTRAFRYTLIPLNDQITHTPAIPFSYFDPLTASFKDLSIPGQAIAVTPGPRSIKVSSGEICFAFKRLDHYSLR
jgi:hypothetical protein